MGSAVKDVENKIKKVLSGHWYDRYLQYLIYGALIAISIVILTVVIKVIGCLNLCKKRTNRRTETGHFEMHSLNSHAHRPSLVRVEDA